MDLINATSAKTTQSADSNLSSTVRTTANKASMVEVGHHAKSSAASALRSTTTVGSVTTSTTSSQTSSSSSDNENNSGEIYYALKNFECWLYSDVVSYTTKAFYFFRVVSRFCRLALLTNMVMFSDYCHFYFLVDYLLFETFRLCKVVCRYG